MISIPNSKYSMTVTNAALRSMGKTILRGRGRLESLVYIKTFHYVYVSTIFDEIASQDEEEEMSLVFRLSFCVLPDS